MLSVDNFVGEDVFEYAAWLGMRDAVLLSGRNSEIFTNQKYPLAVEMRLCYDLGYDLEKASNELLKTLRHKTTAFIREWNDLRGWGILETVRDGRVLKLDFSYHDLTQDMADASLDPGELLNVTYRVLDNKILEIAK